MVLLVTVSFFTSLMALSGGGADNYNYGKKELKLIGLNYQRSKCYLNQNVNQYINQEIKLDSINRGRLLALTCLANRAVPGLLRIMSALQLKSLFIVIRE